MGNKKLFNACFSMLFGLPLMAPGASAAGLPFLIGMGSWLAIAVIFLVIAGERGSFLTWSGYFKPQHIDNPDHSGEVF